MKRAAAQSVVAHPEHWYPTPAAVTRALLAHVRFEGGVWEPACGDGAMARVIEAAGYNVVASDLVSRAGWPGGVDFLTARRERAPNIITNPPFKLATGFASQALELASGGVAMLLSVSFLGGTLRARDLFARFPPRLVLTSARRFEMWPGGVEPEKSGGSTEVFAWFVWGRCLPQRGGALQWFDWRDFEGED